MPEKASFIAIEKTEKGLKKRKEIRKGDIVITFKSLDLAFKVITGQKGLCQSYAEHDFMLDGNIYDTMGFTRIVELVEAHLFSKKRSKTMGTFTKIISGTGILIAIYLFVKNSKGAVAIINSLGGVYSSGVKTLQGR